MESKKQLLLKAINASIYGGHAIMKVYNSDFSDVLSELDFKGILLKHSQKVKGKIEYKKEKTLDDENAFSVSLFYNGKRIIRSTGNSKKEAEQKAAKEGIKILF